MAATPSTMLPLGTKMPSFRLPEPATDRQVSSADLKGPVVVVAFICNHCPFVKHIRPQLAEFGRWAKQRGADVVAISSNDVENYPDDSPEKMAEEVERAGYVFPYLFDDSQDVARAFQAACTPDFFVFDEDRRLVYRGQFDDSRPSSGSAVTGKDLRAAVEAALAGKPVAAEQKPSIGCNIKWK